MPVSFHMLLSQDEFSKLSLLGARDLPFLIVGD